MNRWNAEASSPQSCLACTSAKEQPSNQHEKGKLKKIDTSLLAETSKAARADKDYIGRKKQADTSELVVREIAQHYKDQIENSALDKEDFGMMMMGMASNMQSPLKRAANLGYMFKDKVGMRCLKSTPWLLYLSQWIKYLMKLS